MAYPPWMEKPSVAARTGKVALLAVLAFLMLFPFVYVIAVSFSSYKDVLGGGLILFPRHPTLEAYRAIFKGGIVVHALVVSIGLTLGGTAVNMLMTVTMAYGLSRPGVPGSRAVLALVLFTLLFSAGLIPDYLLVRNLGLIDTYGSVILPGAINAFNLVILRQFFMSLPSELLESARLDGASDLRVLLRIVLPLSKPVLAVIALFYGVAHWNDFFRATLYLNDAHKWPIQLVLRQYVLQGSALANAVALDPNQPPSPAQTIQMAVVVVATVPILIVYPVLQRYFTRGVLTGAIKG
ncbi:MAG: carbohydrate ABC transporter permease [Chloroflexota bacterium]|nr:carbohydrate ABC transporter permease [Chloroflexota bacterium]